MTEEKNIFGEEYEIKRAKGASPMTSAEIKELLKKVAGLSYGLACDIGNMEIKTQELEKRLLKYEAKEKGITPKELLRQKELQKIGDKKRYEEKRKKGENVFNVRAYVDDRSITSRECKERLKEIAGLCYSLVGELEKTDELQARVKELETEIVNLNFILRRLQMNYSNRSPEAQERHIQKMREHYQNNRERIRVQQKEYYERKKKKCSEPTS